MIHQLPSNRPILPFTTVAQSTAYIDCPAPAQHFYHSTSHPIDHILNELPRRPAGLKKRHWCTTWPLLLQALREIDIATHPVVDNSEQEPEPPPAQALEDFLAEQAADAANQLADP